MSFQSELVKVPAAHINELFMGTYEKYRNEFLKGKWSSYGVKRNNFGEKKPPKILNPRLHGNFEFKYPDTLHLMGKKNWIYQEHLKCAFCEAKLKLVYRASSEGVLCIVYSPLNCQHQ